MREIAPVVLAAVIPFLILILIVTGTAAGIVRWSPPEIWSLDFGTPNSQNGISTISGDATGVYAGGFYGHTLPYQLNVTPSSLFVNRYDLAGRQIWIRTFSSPQTSQIDALGVGQGGIYLSGILSSRSFVMKYDVNGNQSWNSTIASGQSGPVTMSASASGTYVGYNLGSSSFLRDYDPSGNVLWTDLVTNNTNSLSVYTTSAAVFAMYSGNVNTTIEKLDTNGKLVWSRSCSCLPIGTKGISGDGNSIYTVTTGPYLSLLISRYDTNGNNMWTNKFTAPDNSGGFAEISADLSGAYVTLESGAGHSFLMKFGTDGVQNWVTEIPPRGSDLDRGVPIVVDSSSLYVGGSISRSGATLNAQLAQFAQSSSLIFFGLIPPWSFIAIGILVGLAAASIYFLRKLRMRAARPSLQGRPTSSYRVTD